MQKGGVSAGIVKNWKDLSEDPQLHFREHFQKRNHKELGYHTYETFGFRLSKTPGGPQTAAPCLGEHNELVCTKILGLSRAVYEQLVADGIFK